MSAGVRVQRREERKVVLGWKHQWMDRGGEHYGVVLKESEFFLLLAPLSIAKLQPTEYLETVLFTITSIYSIYKLLPIPANLISSHLISSISSIHYSIPSSFPSPPAQPSSRRGGFFPLALTSLARPDISVTVLPLHQLPQPTDFRSLFLQLTTIL